MKIPEWFAETETVFVCVPDHIGRLSGKRIASDRLPEVLSSGLPVPDFHLITDLDLDTVPGMAASGASTGYPNGVLFPALETLRRAPWDSSTAIILADACRGRETPSLMDEAPRSILGRQLDRLSRLGYSLRVSTELEFYVFRLPYAEAFDRGYQELPPYYHRRGDNDVLVTEFFEPFAGRVREAARSLGFPVETTQGEGGAGQIELNFPPRDPMAAADSHVLFKHAVKAVAHSMDVAATFMAKALTSAPGSGCHLNLSLQDSSGQSLMGADVPSGERSLGAIAESFLAGLLSYSPELILLHAPFGNSYRRFSSSGMAPRTVSWGYDNRTVMVRVAGSGRTLRLELRLPGADCNPYLSLAGAIAAGAAGIENQLALPAPVSGDALAREDLPTVPLDLTEAVDAFGTSALAASAFGDHVRAHVIGHARHELTRQRIEVTDRELIRGFEAS